MPAIEVTMGRVPTLVLAVAAALLAAPAHAAVPCGGGSFEAWLDGFKREAAAAGITQRGLAALNGVTYDEKVVARDRQQGVFRQTFEQFSARMISADRMRVGARKLKQFAGTFERIEQRFGVPGAVITAIWGLETDYGVNQGNFSTIRALASLSYDCRRSERFQAELMDALRIVDRGDLAPAEMRGAWAGEIGQTQFLPSSYLKFAIDFDGNGKRDLIRSVPDVLASTANYLQAHGWQRDQPWEPGSANFETLREWNKSEVYSKTVAEFAKRLEQE
jgi:lytic murein transglycosylase